MLKDVETPSNTQYIIVIQDAGTRKEYPFFVEAQTVKEAIGTAMTKTAESFPDVDFDMLVVYSVSMVMLSGFVRKLNYPPY